MTFEDAVKEVYYWQYDNPNSFYSGILTLYQKADSGNRRKLKSVYPELIQAYEAWCLAGECGDELFKEHGLLK